MCLDISSRSKVAVTKVDIVCYKTLNKREVFFKKLKTIEVKGTTYKVSSKLTLKSLATDFSYTYGKLYKTTLDRRHSSVERGFHAFTGHPETIRKRELRATRPDRILVECVIPAGSQYYRGTNNGMSRGIVSNQIKIVKQL